MTAQTLSATLTRLTCTPRQACPSGDRATVAPDSRTTPEPLCEGANHHVGECVLDLAAFDGGTGLAAARRLCVVSCIDDALALLHRARERAAAGLGGAARGTVRVLVVAAHDIRREGLLRLVSGIDGIEVVGAAAAGEAAVDLAARARPDVVLLDVTLPDIDGPEVARRLLAASRQLQILMVTGISDEGRVREAIEAGVIGYLLDDVGRAELVEAIIQAAVGRPTLHPTVRNHLLAFVAPPPPAPSPSPALSKRDRNLMRLLGLGYSNRAIAEALGFTHGTVKVYVSALLEKLGVTDRTQAALLAARSGLDAPEGAGPPAINPG